MGSLLAEREFEAVPGVAPAASDLAPRCYEVMWGRIDSLYNPNRISMIDADHLPSVLVLKPDVYVGNRRATETWRVLTMRDPDTDSASLRATVQFSGWRTAGSDSIDVLIDVFPMVLRLRFTSDSADVLARTVLSWDTPGTELLHVRLRRREWVAGTGSLDAYSRGCCSDAISCPD